MAGEIEEPFRLNFQADLLHSGSISFGRFESESLSWERRSIFSHNRYLEEVERCSKPGSVTEKKAYFEAEFRRKALLRQQSSECQHGAEIPTNSNNDLNNFEESGISNESSCSYYNPSECNIETEIQHYEKWDVETIYAENGNDSRLGDNSGYDEIQECESQNCEIQECESQNCEFVSVTTHIEPVINMVDCSVSVSEHIKLDETQKSETENLVGNTEESIGLTNIDQVVEVDFTSVANDSSVICQTPKKDHDSTCSGPQTTFSPKVNPASEKKLMKTRVNVDRFQKHVSNEPLKGSTKLRTNESKSLLVKKTEKKSPRPATPLTCSGAKTSKSEKQELRLKKSIVKDIKSEKLVKTRIPLSQKPLPGVHPTVHRSKQIISSSKTHVTQTAAGFSLKTDKRAENRKEFYMKIADKMHAKEAVINQVEAKTREKQAAEMKQFRKSLTFKAKPMPSFYNESTRSSDQHKVTPMSKLPNQRPSSQSMATRGTKNASKSCVPSYIRPTSATSSTNRLRLSESVGKNHVQVLKKQKEPESQMVKRHPKGIHMVAKSGIF